MTLFTVWAVPALSAYADDDLGRVVSNTYKQFPKSTTAGNLASIRLQVEQAYQNKDYAGALKTLATYRALDSAYAHDDEMQAVIRLALQLYCQNEVEHLLAEARQQADPSFEAKLVFELSRFYADNEQWSKVTSLLSNDSLFEQLTTTDLAEAYILLGTALQKQKKHRESIYFYEKISVDSEHYRLAQLNLASAFIRQDWWTDANTAITSALKKSNKKRDALDYRLYTTLGFSQIQFGFYRDARESFRNVAISSEYVQRALLGLGIAALHQQDFIGALNAFDKLRGQQKKDISVAEAYLLSAFTLRQLGQIDAATSRYQEAIDYYQKISNELAAQLNSKTPLAITFLRLENNNDKLLRNNTRKIALLDGLATNNSNPSQTSLIASLRNKYSDETGQHAGKLLREEKEAIDSYLSQSRFGLASLYDQK